jgi:hypothetical protein
MLKRNTDRYITRNQEEIPLLPAENGKDLSEHKNSPGRRASNQ